ncbi:MAG: anthranilate synthase component I [Thiohalomonadales bacterium]
MNQQQFSLYQSQNYNRVPVVREVFADLDTPLSTYLKLAEGPYSYLFESIQGGDKWGRYSIIGLPCTTVVRVYDKTIKIIENNEIVSEQSVEDPLQWLEDFHASYRAPELEHLPRFVGGLVGYFGYDTIRYIEPKLGKCPNPDPLGVPDILFMVSNEVVVFDNISSKLIIVIHADANVENALEKANQRIDELCVQLQQTIPRTTKFSASKKTISEDDFVSGFTQQAYEESVEKARQYIIDGDAMQIVLSQRLTIPFESNPLDLYRALRSLNPSPYMYYMNLDDFYIVGSSPEILVHLEDEMVTVRPLAGTRPRGKNDEHDKQLEKELLADPKECAEHLMLIDLGRNDIGRIAETGTVKVTETMGVERYSHVMHIVSNVVGKLNKKNSAMDVLRATFPAGTLSGAPKIRAMEIIDELEPVKRGVYSGAVGYLSWTGNMDTAIAIRTAVIKDKKLHIQAGAGLVFDSIPEKEWDETMNKGRAIFRAVSMAVAGLDNFANIKFGEDK